MYNQVFSFVYRRHNIEILIGTWMRLSELRELGARQRSSHGRAQRYDHMRGDPRAALTPLRRHRVRAQYKLGTEAAVHLPLRLRNHPMVHGIRNRGLTTLIS